MAELATFFGSINLSDLRGADSLTSRILEFMQQKHPGAYAKMPKPTDADESEIEGFSTYQDFSEYMYTLALFFEEQEKSAYLDFWFEMLAEDPDQLKDYLFPPMGYSPQMQEECLQLLKSEYDYDSFVEMKQSGQSGEAVAAKHGTG